MIEVQNLTKRYGTVTAIRDVSFAVAPGEIVGFLGPNGAGKSTTMRILSCFMPATSGSARVAGYDVFRESMEVRRRIGYLPESVPLYGDMRVAPYLDFVAEVKGVPRSDVKTNGDLGSCSRCRRRSALSSSPTMGWVAGVPRLTRRTCSVAEANSI